MDSNKEEANRCRRIAENAIKAGDIDKAIRLLEKSYRMYPSNDVDDILKKLKDQREVRSNCQNKSSQGDLNSDCTRYNASKVIKSPISNSDTINGSTSSKESPELLCKRILKAKDYYATLGVSRDADDVAIKKAYKKLALLLHPDKCKASSAEEAFKKIALAFQTLSDTEKRQIYDQYGENGPPIQSNSSDVRYYQYHGSMDGFLTPEDLFRMFFGGMSPNITFQQRQRQARHNRNNQNSDRDQQHQYNDGMFNGHLWQKFTGIIQIIPIVLMILLALLGNFIPSYTPNTKATYSLSRNREYYQQKWTGIHNVPFYINPKSGFDRQYPQNSSKLHELEVQIEMLHFTRECGIEERTLLQDIAYAKYYQNKEKLREIQSRQKPNCDKLKWLRDSYPNIYRQIIRH
ncbi:hypothetical protein cand_013500 [Cryptosporidium andersoni]|uniref:J domain-containing protein n=1 Tax=Cryptosporidium andersoni TaxID=117008 RepID=A0A1J4MUB2_9CRYT|nr:hypothetical protein cand_013500 [Cryptosporidium andersoni]